MEQASRRLKGFSLVELLVVIFTVSVLTGILVPAVLAARQQTQRTVCLNNMRQMAMAAATYATVYDDCYPLAIHHEADGNGFRTTTWDFNRRIREVDGEEIVVVVPGLLWMGQTNKKIQQCPVFKGSANWEGDPYTGYNYNTSYIGLNETHIPAVSATRTIEVRTPSETVIFGDGEYINGANKFMRAPFPNPRERAFSNGFRHAGVQGFRHLHTTNVAYCDGHAGFLRKVYTQTNRTSQEILEAHNEEEENKIGFLSEDNRLYDLK